MDRLVYTAMSGLRSQMQSQATIANNIANASTPGYKARDVDFRAALNGGYLKSLVVDEDTAHAVLGNTGSIRNVA